MVFLLSWHCVFLLSKTFECHFLLFLLKFCVPSLQRLAFWHRCHRKFWIRSFYLHSLTLEQALAPMSLFHFSFDEAELHVVCSPGPFCRIERCETLIPEPLSSFSCLDCLETPSFLAFPLPFGSLFRMISLPCTVLGLLWEAFVWGMHLAICIFLYELWVLVWWARI